MKQQLPHKRQAGKQRYDNLDGLRAYAAIGIVLMHVLSNGAYGMGGLVFGTIVPSFADLVFVFMVISGFAMCCGYYEKMVSGQVDLGAFYIKRFAKVWPFFAVMCVVDFAMSPSVDTLYELLADLTLCFGLIPNAAIGVIGVGWFLGLVFVFYFMFPLICAMLTNKKRAWLAFAVSLLISTLCVLYFKAPRASIAYSGVFFMAGCMIYLYREPLRRLVNRYGLYVGLLTLVAVVLYYLIGSHMPLQLLVAVFLTLLAIGRKNVVLHNVVTKRISAISLEIYLCHMMVFRVLERIKLTHLFQSALLSYMVTAVATLAGSIMVALVVNWALSALGGVLQKRKTGGKNNVQ